MKTELIEKAYAIAKNVMQPSVWIPIVLSRF